MIARIILGIVLAIGSASAAPVPKEMKKVPDSERIQGIWSIDKTGGDTRWLFRDGKFYSFQITAPENLGQEYRFELLPNGGIDLILDARTTQYGIYKFEGDDLLIARGNDGVRPKNFDPDPLKNVLRFRRDPEAKK